MTLPLFDPSHHDIRLDDPDPLARIAETSDRLVLARLADRAGKAGKRDVAEAAEEKRAQIPRGNHA